MKKAILFDMDGLMIDSERWTFEEYVRVCKKYGYDMSFSFYETLLGYPMKVNRVKMIRYFGQQFPLEQIIREVHSSLDERFDKEGVPVKEGLNEILEFARDNKYHMLVASSSDKIRVERILKCAGIESYFDGVVCGDEVEYGKPDPEIFLRGCKKLGVKPEEAYVLEDSEAGVLAGCRAGATVICVPDMKLPSNQISNLAVRVASSLCEAMEIIKKNDSDKIKVDVWKNTLDFKLDHICIITSNYEETLRFYVEILGFVICKESYSESHKAKKLELYDHGKYLIEIFVLDEKYGAEDSCDKYRGTINHIAFSIRNLYSVIKLLHSYHIKMTNIKRDKQTGNRYIFCWAPEGTRIEFYER